MFKLDEKFLMIEFSDLNSKFKENTMYVSKFFSKLMAENKMFIGNYFKDGKCGFVSLETEEGYLIYLYFLANYNYLELKKNLSKDRGIETYIFQQKDILNVYKYLILNVDCSSEIEYSNSPLLFKYHGELIIKKIFLNKKEYSKKEAEYWSNVCLKLFVYFQKSLIYRDEIYKKKYASKFLDLFQTSNYYDIMYKEILKIYKINTILFLIDSCMSYNERTLKLDREIKGLLFDNIIIKND